MTGVAVYAGPAGRLSEVVCAALIEAGYLIGEVGDACDLFVDNISRSSAQAHAAALVAGRPRHYVLISSSHVYPATEHLRPWTPADADIVADLAAWATPELLNARRVEREVRLLHAGRTPLTILRPARIDGEEGDEHARITAYFCRRVSADERVVLPEGGLPLYRFAAPEDVAAAVVAVALRPDAFDRVLNVANEAVLTYWGHAALVRDGLRKQLSFVYAPRDRWVGSSLRLPGLDQAWATLIQVSDELRGWGWSPVDPLRYMTMSAANLVLAHDPADVHAHERERALADALQRTPPAAPKPGAVGDTPREPRSLQWRLDAWSGEPASLNLIRTDQVRTVPLPTLRVRRLAMLAAEERFLRGEYPQHGHRALGHSALLEVHASIDEAVPAGSLALPMATMPCADPADCLFCRDGSHGVVGIGCDGYGLGLCTTPATHLVPVPPELADYALLADPLACLTNGLPGERWQADKGPVWIAGRTVEAALAAWIAHDLGRSVTHVDRVERSHDEFPTKRLEGELERLRAGELERPTLAFDFTGSPEVSWPLSTAILPGGHLFVHRRPPGVASGIHWHHMPVAAWSKEMLVEALAQLARWERYRDVRRRVGPAVPLDLFWDVFLPVPFALPFLEDLRP